MDIIKSNTSGQQNLNFSALRWLEILTPAKDRVAMLTLHLALFDNHKPKNIFDYTNE